MAYKGVQQKKKDETSSFGGSSFSFGFNPSTQTANSTVAFNPDASSGIGNLVKSVGQSIAKGYIGVAQELETRSKDGFDRLMGKEVPKRKFGSAQFIVPGGEGMRAKFIRGVTGLEPYDTISLQSEGEQFPFVSKGSKVAPFLAVGSVAADFVGPWGKGITGLSKGLKAADNFVDAGKLLRAVNFSEEIVLEWGPKFAKMNNAKEIEKTLLSLEKLQNSSKAVGKVTDLASGVKTVGPDATKQLPIPEGLPKIAMEEGEILAKNTITPGTRSTKSIIRESVSPSSPMVTKPESQLLKSQIRAEARTAKIVAKNTRIKVTDELLDTFRGKLSNIQGVKNTVVQFAKEYLPKIEQGRALNLVKDAKTQNDLAKSFVKINNWADNFEKKALRNEILETSKRIADSSSVAVDYQKQVKDLLGNFELTGHRDSTIESIRKTRDFFTKELAAGKDVTIPRDVVESLAILNRTPFEKMTLSQLQGIRTEIEMLEHLGKTKLRTFDEISKAKKAKIISDIAEQGSTPLNNHPILKPKPGEKLPIGDKFRNFIRNAQNKFARVDKVLSPIDVVLDLLDGGTGSYAGQNYKYFKGQIDNSFNKYYVRKESVQQPVIDLVKKHGIKDSNLERIGLVAAREQEGGLEKLLASGFSEADINAVKLTVPEREILDAMRSAFEQQFPDIQDVMRRVHNKPVEKVKNYFSFMTDWRAMDDTELWERFGQNAEQFGAPRKNVEAGFTKARTGGAQKIKLNALDVFLETTDNSSYLVEMSEKTKMLAEVAGSPEFAQLAGDAGQLLVREWLDVIARKGGASGAVNIPVLDTLRKNIGASILGLKLSTIAIQPTAFIDGAGMIGSKYATLGAKNFLTDSNWRGLVMKMPELADRMGGEFAIRELVDSDWFHKIQRKGFIPMQKVDQYTAGAVAAGAYERKMRELGLSIDFTKPLNKEAVEYAQLVVRRTQSSGNFKDVPLAVSRGALTGNRSFDRAVLQFQNFLLTRWSRIRHDAIRAGINTRDPKKAVPIFTAVIMAALAGAGIRAGVNKVQDLLTGKEDGKELGEELLTGASYELIGNVPFLGSALSMALYNGEAFPLLSAPKDVVQGLYRALNSSTESAKLKGLTDFAGGLGGLAGVPGTYQAQKLIRDSITPTKKASASKSLPTPPGFPKLPTASRKLPIPPGLPKL